MRVLLSVVIVVTAASASILASASGGSTQCGRSPKAGEHIVALTSMRSATPLYVVENSGRMVKVDLRTNSKIILSDHNFSMMPSLRPSGDGRWLSYNGVLKGKDKTQYWLYDRHKHSDQLVYEHPAWGGGIPSFSPDSRYLLISAGYDRRWSDTSGVGVYLLDTTSMRVQAVPLPALEANKTAWVSASWSKDGKELLILVRNMSAKGGFDYFSYRLATKKIEPLSGRYVREASRHEFMRGTQVIPESEEIRPQSELGGRFAWSPERTRHAYLEERKDDLPYQLWVASKKGIPKSAATGHYEQCAGNTLYISGWLDERHLVYRNSMSYIIFDAQTGTTADLFNSDDMLTFAW